MAGELAPPADGLAELPVEGEVVEPDPLEGELVEPDPLEGEVVGLELLEGEVVEPEPPGEVAEELDERGVEAP